RDSQSVPIHKDQGKKDSSKSCKNADSIYIFIFYHVLPHIISVIGNKNAVGDAFHSRQFIYKLAAVFLQPYLVVQLNMSCFHTFTFQIHPPHLGSHKSLCLLFRLPAAAVEYQNVRTVHSLPV